MIVNRLNTGKITKPIAAIWLVACLLIWLAGFTGIASAQTGAVPDLTGLWVGQIEITRVNESGSQTETGIPTATSHPFEMRIILHADARGQVRLLWNVMIMQKRHTDAAGNEVLTRVLVTDKTLLSTYEGIVRRDGKLTGVRLSSPAFRFDPSLNELPLSGNLGPGRSVSGSLILTPDHPINPFRHKYHPDHRTGREISRQFTLNFDDDQGTTPETGLSKLRGTYQETVTGLHKIPVKAEGTFSLRRISAIGTLNDEG